MSIEWNRRYQNDFLDSFVNDTWFRLKVIGGIIAAGLILWFIIHIITYRQIVTTTVTYIGWDTAIQVQRYQTNNHGDWYVPNGGRVTNSYTKQRGTVRVLDHYERNRHTRSGGYTGTGKNRRSLPDVVYYTSDPVYRNDPVYDTWYEYDLDEWTFIEPLRAKGTGHEWYMPDTSDGTYNDIPQIGNKRLGMPMTHFFIVFHGDKQDYTADMPEDRWKMHAMGGRYDITLNWLGQLLEINKAGSW